MSTDRIKMETLRLAEKGYVTVTSVSLDTKVSATTARMTIQRLAAEKLLVRGGAYSDRWHLTGSRIHRWDVTNAAADD